MAVKGSFMKPDWLRNLGLLVVISGAIIMLLGVVNTAVNSASDNIYTKVSVSIWAAIPIIITGAFALWMAQRPCSQNDFFPIFLSLSLFIFAPMIMIISLLEIGRAVEISTTRFILPSVITVLAFTEIMLLTYCMIKLCRHKKSEQLPECAKQPQKQLIDLNVSCPNYVPPQPQPQSQPQTQLVMTSLQPAPISACMHQPACYYSSPDFRPHLISTVAADNRLPPLKRNHSYNVVKREIEANDLSQAVFAPSYPIFGRDFNQGQLYGSQPRLNAGHAC